MEEKPRLSAEDAILASPEVRYIPSVPPYMLTEAEVREIARNVMDCSGKRDRWMIPLGTLVPIVAALATTSFAETFGIPASDWWALFVLSGLLNLGWLTCTLVQRRRSTTVDSIIEDLRKRSRTAEITVRPIEVKLPAEQRPAEEVPAHGAQSPAPAGRYRVRRAAHSSRKKRQADQFVQLDPDLCGKVRSQALCAQLTHVKLSEQVWAFWCRRPAQQNPPGAP